MSTNNKTICLHNQSNQPSLHPAIFLWLWLDQQGEIRVVVVVGLLVVVLTVEVVVVAINDTRFALKKLYNNDVKNLRLLSQLAVAS